MAAVKRDYKAHDVLYLVEQFQLKKLGDDYEEIDATRNMYARKYLRGIIKNNNKIIGQIIQEYCAAKGYVNTDKYYQQAHLAFAENFLNCSTKLRHEYNQISDFAKLINVLDLYGMYCFNEFQKMFIREVQMIPNKKNISSLTGLIGYVFRKNFLEKDNANSRKPTNPKFPLEPIQLEKPYIKKGQGLYFNSNLIKLLPDQNLYGATLKIKNPKVEEHVQRYIKAEVAMLYNRTVEAGLFNYIKPYEIIGSFNTHDWKEIYKNAVLESHGDNPYFASSDNRRTAGRNIHIEKEAKEWEEVEDEEFNLVPTDCYTSDYHPLFLSGDGYCYADGTPYNGSRLKRVDDTLDFVYDEDVEIVTHDEVKVDEEEPKKERPKIYVDNEGYLQYHGNAFTKITSNEIPMDEDEHALDEWMGRLDGKGATLYTYKGTTIMATASKYAVFNKETGEYEIFPLHDEAGVDGFEYEDDGYPRY